MKLYRALLIACTFVAVGSNPAWAGVPGPGAGYRRLREPAYNTMQANVHAECVNRGRGKLGLSRE